MKKKTREIHGNDELLIGYLHEKSHFFMERSSGKGSVNDPEYWIHLIKGVHLVEIAVGRSI